MNKIDRILIITISEHSCAKYLATNIASLKGVNVMLLSQKGRTVSQKNIYWRLLKRRGFLIFIDTMFMVLSRKTPTKYFLGPSPPVNGKYAMQLDSDWPAFDVGNWESRLKGIRREETPNVNSNDGLRIIREFSPHVILLAGAPIVSERVIEMAHLGTLNPHQGITPRYAGNSPVIWPLYENHEYDIGYTIHYVVPQVDSGPILEQTRLPWQPRWDWGTIGRYTGQIMYDRLATITRDWIVSQERPAGRSQEVPTTRPPAGYFVSKVAERNKARLFNQGRLVITPPDWNQDLQTKIALSRLALDSSETDNDNGKIVRHNRLTGNG